MSEESEKLHVQEGVSADDPYASFRLSVEAKHDPADPNTLYPLGLDSQRQNDIPFGKLIKRSWSNSQIYPDSETDYWVYVPSQYEPSKPACLMVFQDGQGYCSVKGSVRAPIVFDNLIHKSEMPITIGVFVNPASGELPGDHREKQYTPLNDAYARFLIDEILVEVEKEYNITSEAEGRGVCGMSDGGLCAFTVAWERPDYFRKVVSHIGSFTRLQGGSQYPYLIRATRGNPLPLRVFLQDGKNDINLQEGDWYLANLMMASAMQFARWDHRCVWGKGGHELIQAGSIFPDTLRWLWRDYPGVQNAETRTNLQLVGGRWDVVLNYGGIEFALRLNVTVTNDELSATLESEKEGMLKLGSIQLKDDVLEFDFATPKSLINLGKGPATDQEPRMQAWVKLSGNTFAGAVSNNGSHVFDLELVGSRSA